MSSYVSLAEFNEYVSDEFGSTESPLRQSALDAAERAVNEFCQRSFAVVAADATPTARLFVPSGTSILRIHDARAVTAVAVSGDTLAASTYQLEPVTVSWSGLAQPYEQIRLLNWYFPVIVPGEATVSVTARWGWAAVPGEVVEATKILAKDILQQRRTMGNLVAAGDFGGVVRINTYVRQLLNPVRRVEAFGFA
jgi:hypothetical protein